MPSLPPCAGTATTCGSANAPPPTSAPPSPPPMRRSRPRLWPWPPFRRAPRKPRTLAPVPVLFALCLTACATPPPVAHRLPIPQQLRQCEPAPAIPPAEQLRTDRAIAELMLAGWLAGADCRAKLARVDELLSQQEQEGNAAAP